MTTEPMFFDEAITPADMEAAKSFKMPEPTSVRVLEDGTKISIYGSTGMGLIQTHWHFDAEGGWIKGAPVAT